MIEKNLEGCVLFKGIEIENLSKLLEKLDTARRHFSKGEILCHMGEEADALGIVLKGRVQIENDDLWGNRSVLDIVGPGKIFAETYACVPGEKMLVNAVAAEHTEVLFIKVMPLFSDCAKKFPGGEMLIKNLLLIMARKNLHLSRRSIDTAPKTIRGKLLSYLSGQAAASGKKDFTIPFNRQQLADYLNVDRSALSGEISRMRREGLLDTYRSHFVLRHTVF